jgi:hypothetical protein
MFKGKYIIQAEPEAALCKLAANLLLDFVCSKKPNLLSSFVIPPAKILHEGDIFESLRFERTWFVHTTDAATLAELLHADKLGKIRFRVNLKTLGNDKSQAYITTIFCRANNLTHFRTSASAMVVQGEADCLPLNNDWLIAINNWLTGKDQDAIANDFVPFMESLTMPLFTDSFSGFVPPDDWKPQPPLPPVYLHNEKAIDFPFVKLHDRTIRTAEFNPVAGVIEIVFTDSTRLLVKPESFSNIALATRTIPVEEPPKQFDPFSL